MSGFNFFFSFLMDISHEGNNLQSLNSVWQQVKQFVIFSTVKNNNFRIFWGLGNGLLVVISFFRQRVSYIWTIAVERLMVGHSCHIRAVFLNILKLCWWWSLWFWLAGRGRSIVHTHNVSKLFKKSFGK